MSVTRKPPRAPGKGSGVYWDSRGHYYISYSKGSNPLAPARTKETFPGTVEGYRQALDRKAQLPDRRQRQSVGISFGELANQYIASRMDAMTESTRENLYYKMDRIIFPAIGSVTVSSLTYKRLDDYRRARTAAGASQATIRREFEYIRAVLNWGVKYGEVGFNPMAGYELPPKGGTRILPMSTDDFNKILAAAAPHLQRAMLLCYYSGLRPGPVELMALRWEHWDRQKNVLQIVSAKKGGIPLRIVPVNDQLRSHLERWFEEDRGQGPIVHYRHRHIKSLKVAWGRAIRRAMVKPTRMYAIRHKSVSDMLAAGMDIKAVAEIVGHKDIATTISIYQETTNPMKRRAVDALSLGE